MTHPKQDPARARRILRRLSGRIEFHDRAAPAAAIAGSPRAGFHYDRLSADMNRYAYVAWLAHLHGATLEEIHP